MKIGQGSRTEGERRLLICDNAVEGIRELDIMKTGGEVCTIFSSWNHKGLPCVGLSTWRDGVVKWGREGGGRSPWWGQIRSIVADRVCEAP